MSQFEKVPTALTTDLTISLQARAVYPALLAEAWKCGARAGERVELPSVPELARVVGCSKNALNRYIAELRLAGWVETVRGSRSRPQAYIIHAVCGPESGLHDAACGPNNGTRVAQNMGHTPSLTDASQTRTPRTPPEADPFDLLTEPPQLTMIDGQNLALNALLKVCEIDPASPRVRSAAVAMNGRDGRDGIRGLYWIECRRVALDRFTDRDEAARALALHAGQRFERVLAARVEAKMALMRQRQPWRRTVTPGDLRSFWLDLEVSSSDDGRPLTPEEIERMGAR